MHSYLFLAPKDAGNLLVRDAARKDAAISNASNHTSPRFYTGDSDY
jgi:hypothetical protein